MTSGIALMCQALAGSIGPAMVLPLVLPVRAGLSKRSKWFSWRKAERRPVPRPRSLSAIQMLLRFPDRPFLGRVLAPLLVKRPRSEARVLNC